MTPSTDPLKPDFLGDDATTTGNSFYNVGASYYNEVTGVNGAVASVEYTPMTLDDVHGSLLIPTGTARWTDSYTMLNIPRTGTGSVHPDTVVLVKKSPIVMGDWSCYTVIVPDASTPGGINTQDGTGKITAFFGGAGTAGRRCYQIISLAFYQGFPTLRGKSTVLEDSFARYSLFVDHDATNGNGSWVLQALPGQSTTLGPVHTNETFKFAVNPDVWNNGPTDPVAFNGLLTYGKYADASSGVVSSLNHDGAVYSQGNDTGGTDINHRPFDNNGAEITGRYSKMIAGGKSNLRQTAPVALPPDSVKISAAAYGTNFSTSLYTAPALSSHVKMGANPDGIFVFPNSSNGRAAGGAVIKGDSKNVFLEVVDGNARPLGVESVRVTTSGASTITSTTAANGAELSGLESGSQPGNPAIRAQGATGITTLRTSTSVSVGTTYSSTRVTLTTGFGSTTSTVTIRSSAPTGSTVRTTLNTNTLYSTSTRFITNTTLTTVPLTTRSTITSTVTTTRVTTLTTGTSVSTWLTTAGGAGGGTFTLSSTIYLSTVSTITGTSTSLRTTTLTTGSSVSTRVSTTTSTTRISTGTTIRTTINTTTLYSTVTSFSVSSGTFPLTTRSWSTSTGYGTTTRTFTFTETFRPIDQLIEARNLDVTLNPTMFNNNSSLGITPSQLYQRPAGAHGNGADMDVSKLSNISTLLVAGASGSLSTMPPSGMTIPTGNVVVIKQSRSDPSTAVVFVVPSVPNDEGALLNGAVYSEGHIGTPGDPNNNARPQRTPGKDGIAGVNQGRKTIGTQIQSTDPLQTNDPDLFGKQPQKPSTSVGIVNNLWQYGTKRYEANKDNLKAENGLGLVSEDVRITAKPGNGNSDGFQSFWDPMTNPAYDGSQNMLNIHAVILAGSKSGGGLTVNGFQDYTDILPGSVEGSATNTPLVRFVGGLILRNYYARINPMGQAGWNSKNIYNQQLALKPPPYFPNNGLLIPLAYIEERIWAEQR